MRLFLFIGVLSIGSCTSNRQIQNSIPIQDWSDTALMKIQKSIANEKYESFYKEKEIPKSLRRATGFRIADVGEDYVKGCVFIKKPFRKWPKGMGLHLALKSKNHVILLYGVGGRAFHTNILFAELDDKKRVVNIWGCSSGYIQIEKETFKYLTIHNPEKLFQ